MLDSGRPSGLRGQARHRRYRAAEACRAIDGKLSLEELDIVSGRHDE